MSHLCQWSVVNMKCVQVKDAMFMHRLVLSQSFSHWAGVKSDQIQTFHQNNWNCFNYIVKGSKLTMRHILLPTLSMVNRCMQVKDAIFVHFVLFHSFAHRKSNSKDNNRSWWWNPDRQLSFSVMSHLLSTWSMVSRCIQVKVAFFCVPCSVQVIPPHNKAKGLRSWSWRHLWQNMAQSWLTCHVFC